MAQVVILGAGLTGLSCAYHLEKNNFHDYLLFEQDVAVGGLCRSIQQDGFTFDYTGHLLHINDPYFRSFIEETIGFDRLGSIDRKSYIYSHGTYTPYPYQMNLYGLPASVIIECIEGFVHKKKVTSSTPSFHDWVLSTFGEGFAKHFFFPYQEKIFDTDLRQVSASWTGRFVPSTSLRDIIAGSIQPAPPQSIGYNAQFFYPLRGGIGSWIESIHHKIKNSAITEHQAIKIDIDKKVIYFSNGRQESYQELVSTLPLDTLLGIVTGTCSTEFSRALSRLRCASVVNFNIGVKRPDLSEKHWIYFPEKTYPFYRVGFHHNFSASMVPVGSSSLYGEFAYHNKPQATVHEMTESSLQAVKKLFGIHQLDVATEKIIHIKYAYIIFDQWRDKNLPNLLASLASQQIMSIGRYGAWKYASMQEGVLDGKETAEHIAAKYTQQNSTPAPSMQIC